MVCGHPKYTLKTTTAQMCKSWLKSTLLLLSVLAQVLVELEDGSSCLLFTSVHLLELTFFSFELQCTLSFPMGHTALNLTDKVGCTSSDPDSSEDSNGVSVFQIGCKINGGSGEVCMRGSHQASHSLMCSDSMSGTLFISVCRVRLESLIDLMFTTIST